MNKAWWLLLGLHGVLLAGGVSAAGHARVEWLAESATVTPGQSLRTAVRMVVEPGWHVYWRNPGMAGVPVKASWELPAGWRSGGLEHPLPIRFSTAGLPGFGHEGEVWFPVVIEVPAAVSGPVELVAQIDWLACSDSSCVPGSARATLALAPGPSYDTPQAEQVRLAHRRAIRPAPAGWSLSVGEESECLMVSVDGPEVGRLAGAEAWVATPDVVDPAARVRFERSGQGMVVRLPFSEYASRPVVALELWVLEPGRESPWRLVWESAAKP